MKTKTKLLVIALVIASALVFDACKKGANDPFLSMKSRTARLKGEWKLMSGTITTNVTGAQESIETYDGIYVVTSVNGTQVNSEAYTDNITFNKNGTYTRIGVRDLVSFDEEGAWAWINKCKQASLKNKEAMGLSATKYTDSNGSNTADAGFYVAGIWMLDELSSKKMVVIINGSSTNGSITTTKTGTYTYEKK